jgi:hypothetical protein
MLAVTVAPSTVQVKHGRALRPSTFSAYTFASTIYETSIIGQMKSQSTVDTDALTISETTTAATEELFFTKTETTTVTTETDVQTTTQTAVPVTETEIQTQSLTGSDPVWRVKARQDGQSDSAVSAYASACVSWAQYVSACSCAGVLPTTVTLGTLSTTITVGETNVRNYLCPVRCAPY